MLFVVSNPDVYKSPTSDVHIVFGEAKVGLAPQTTMVPTRALADPTSACLQVEDQSQQAQMATAQQLAAASGLSEEEEGDECVFHIARFVLSWPSR